MSQQPCNRCEHCPAADFTRANGALLRALAFPGMSSSRCWITSPARQLCCSRLLGSVQFATTTVCRSWLTERTHLEMYFQASTFLPSVQIGTPVRLNLWQSTADGVTRIPASMFVQKLMNGLTMICNGVHVNIIRSGNLHKWCFTPKGSAFLWVSKERQQDAQGVVISHQ